MKILYIHQYFNTPDLGGPTRSYWISKKLKEDGHDVFMLTTVGDKKVPKREIYKGINIINIHVPYSSEMGVLRRIKSFIQFMVLSSLHVLGKEKYDLIIATSTPLTVGVPALMSKKIKKRPYIFEVRDLWPEAPIQMGILTNKALIAITKWFEKAIYKNAKHIVALSPGMVKGVLETDVPKEKITMIPNMSKIDIFWPRKKKLSIIQELKLSPHSFKVVYFGSMGPTNGMDYIIDAAKLIGPEDNIEFLFFGGGPDENLLKERCRKEQIKNTRFYDDQP
ncbi:MAG: glycosyltransferase family 4 protein, partial [Flavobacteriaceae bacterium]